MATEAELIAQVAAATGYVSMTLLRTESVGDATRKQYSIIYRVGGYPRIDVINILIFADNSAEWMDSLPAILDVPVTSAWKTAILAKKANLLATVPEIKRILIRVINEEDKWAIAVSFKLVSGKITPITYFLYDLNGVLTFYEYTGSIWT